MANCTWSLVEDRRTTDAAALLEELTTSLTVQCSRYLHFTSRSLLYRTIEARSCKSSLVRLVTPAKAESETNAMSTDNPQTGVSTVHEAEGASTTTSGSLFPPSHLKASASELPEVAKDAQGPGDAGAGEGQPVGYLPPPEQEDTPEDRAQKLDLGEGGASFNFDALGPMVVNKDGVSALQA